MGKCAPELHCERRSGRQYGLPLYREKYPLTISEAVEVSGLTIEDLIDKLREMVNATKWVWDNDRGTYIETNILTTLPASVRIAPVLPKKMKLIAEGQGALREKGKDAMPDRE